MITFKLTEGLYNKMKRSSQNSFTGTATVELAVVVVVLLALIGIGAYVVQSRQAAVTASTTNTIPAPKIGTTASIEKLTKDEATSESQADNTADASTQQNISSTNTTISNVGGAYDESTL